MNRVILMGRLTDNIQLNQTQSGKTVTNFTLAVNRRYQSDTTDFIRCIAWEKTAEFIYKFFRKGSMLAVEGEINTRTYTDREGRTQHITEVRVDNGYFTGEKQNATQQPTETPTEYAAPTGNDDFYNIPTDDSDLPF